MGLQDSLGFVLRKAAHELAAAVHAFEGRATKLGQVSAVQASAPDVLSCFEERRKETDGIQDLKGARLDRRGTRLSVPPDLPLDQPHLYSVAGEFTGSEQPRRSGAHDQHVVLCHQLRFQLKSAQALKTQMEISRFPDRELPGHEHLNIDFKPAAT
jgi:hypothetical protein